MKSRTPLSLFLTSALLATGCATAPVKPSAPAPKTVVPAEQMPAGKPAPASASDGKSVQSAQNDLDEYDPDLVADPLEPLNRATFWLNHGLYMFVFKPISKTYEAIIPKPVRKGVHNAFENVKFPVRLVNDGLQGNFKRAGLETGRFLVNTTAGVGGIGRPADHIPALADVPSADTGQTFAKWGVGHGAYLVLPVLGPSSLRDTVGLAGDYALNPVSWVTIWYGGYAWTLAIPSTNTLRAMPDQVSYYEAATKNAIDRYLAARASYIQYRRRVAAK